MTVRFMKGTSIAELEREMQQVPGEPAGWGDSGSWKLPVCQCVESRKRTGYGRPSVYRSG